jgi:hypothetical protein
VKEKTLRVSCGDDERARPQVYTSYGPVSTPAHACVARLVKFQRSRMSRERPTHDDQETIEPTRLLCLGGDVTIVEQIRRGGTHVDARRTTRPPARGLTLRSQFTSTLRATIRRGARPAPAARSGQSRVATTPHPSQSFTPPSEPLT